MWVDAGAFEPLLVAHDAEVVAAKAVGDDGVVEVGGGEVEIKKDHLV